MTNLDSVLKSRDITSPTKVCIVSAMVFPVVTYRCESWTIKKVEASKNWYFQIMELEKSLESPLDCKDEQLLSAFLFPSEISTSKIVRLGTSLREVGNGNPLQYSCLENSIDRGAWWPHSLRSQRVKHGWPHMHTCFPGCPVVKTFAFRWGGCRFYPQ